MPPYRTPPGLFLIAHDVLPSLTSPVIVTGALYQMITRLGWRENVLPTFSDPALVTVLLAGSIAGKVIIKSIWNSFKRWSDKRRLGAIDVPVVRKGKLPGNISFVLQLFRNFSKEYPGEPLVHLKEEYGPIYDLNFLWEGMVCLNCSASSDDLQLTDGRP